MNDTTATTRATRQRAEVRRVLEQATDFQSAQDIHAELRRQGVRIGLTTVYRTVQSLEAAGEIDALRLAGGETKYRQCGAAHHHHLTCQRCQATVEVTEPDLESWVRSVAEDNGFSAVHHTIELTGLCQECSSA